MYMIVCIYIICTIIIPCIYLSSNAYFASSFVFEVGMVTHSRPTGGTSCSWQTVETKGELSGDPCFRKVPGDLFIRNTEIKKY